MGVVDQVGDNYSQGLNHVDDWRDDSCVAHVQCCYSSEEQHSYFGGCYDWADYAQHDYSGDMIGGCGCEVDGLHAVDDGLNVDHDGYDDLCYDDYYVIEDDDFPHDYQNGVDQGEAQQHLQVCHEMVLLQPLLIAHLEGGESHY